ncbi:MAG TPA: ABC transporter permease [Bellilinea sp.]|nr:ABC transporter permease [Bellilinea sp.]
MTFAKRLFRRAAGGLAALLVASFLAFMILEASPGDVTDILVGDSATQAEKDAVRQEMGLDRPVIPRYFEFMENLLLHGDLGRSAVNNRPVTELIAQRFVNTFLLAISATLLALVVGVQFGLHAALHSRTWLDTLLSVAMAAGLSTPVFGLAILLTQVFSVQLGWLPAIGAGSIRHFVLPVLSLAVPTAAVIARLTRSSLLETLQMQYVTTAHGKGVPRNLVWRRHILRNSLVPVISLVGVQFGHLLAGAFIVETIFAWPGLGRLTVQAIFDQDYPVVLGSVILAVVIFQVLNLIVDLIHSLLDPRIRTAEA